MAFRTIRVELVAVLAITGVLVARDYHFRAVANPKPEIVKVAVEPGVGSNG